MIDSVRALKLVPEQRIMYLVIGLVISCCGLCVRFKEADDGKDLGITRLLAHHSYLIPEGENITGQGRKARIDK